MIPQARMLKSASESAAAVEEIEAQGGIAWVWPEYGSDMGHENVYWGEKLYWFTPEQVREACGRQ